MEIDTPVPTTEIVTNDILESDTSENCKNPDENDITHEIPSTEKECGLSEEASSSNINNTVEEKTEDSATVPSNSPNCKRKLKKKYHLTAQLKETLKSIPGALEYIEQLHVIIEKQIKKITKWKSRLKKSQKHKRKTKVASTQTILHEFCYGNSSQNHSEDNVPKSISDEIKEAAEEFVSNSGFVYEETSGMYYDYNTGYYYNAEYGLYYDGNSGTYMKYNQETKTYDFHSQVPHQQHEPTKPAKRKTPLSRKKVSASTMDALAGSFDSLRVDSLRAAALDIAKQWPPCMRIIIESSASPSIKQGSLHIVTCDGGTLGREGKHSILLPDLNVSKHHLKFSFDKESSKYLLTDLGSRNGTYLNSKRMSSSKQESEPLEVTHGSKIQIGSNILLCHIHEGSHTCGHCEPGLIQPKEKEKNKLDKASVSDKHKIELKKLKKQCGFFAEGKEVKLASGYTDRAQKRRETVGSQDHNEKTQVASVNESIPAENKGFKLLSKMGWKEGQSLGKTGEGITEPIKLVSNEGTTGIGAESFPVLEKHSSSAKENIWKKAQERFEKISNKVENNATEEDVHVVD